MAVEYFYYRDACDAAAIKQGLETGCRACVFRGFDKDRKEQCGAKRDIFPEGTQKSCTFWRRKKA